MGGLWGASGWSSHTRQRSMLDLAELVGPNRRKIYSISGCTPESCLERSVQSVFPSVPPSPQPPPARRTKPIANVSPSRASVVDASAISGAQCYPVGSVVLREDVQSKIDSENPRNGE